jgi:uncharacterized protein YukE
MTGDLRVDPQALRAAEPGIEVTGDLVGAALARLAAALDAEGQCWGDDMSGHAFGDAYRPAEREVRAAFVRVAGRLHEVGEVVTRVADVVAAADARARARLG